jgi:large subunit ribosomal protein L9
MLATIDSRLQEIQKAKKEAKALEDARALAEEISKISVTIPVKVGEEEKIFGSVTTQMIADALKEKGYEVDKKKIEIPETIKTLGIYDIKVKLHHAVEATIKTWVVRE